LATTKIEASNIATGAVPSTGLTSVQVFTSSSTWTKPTDITKVIIEVQGAGGSGSAQAANYGSGAAGGFAKKLLDVSNTTTATATVGTGGAAKSADAGAGIAGGLSSFVELSGTGGWTDVVGNGGAGHPGTSSSAAGGTATGGDINITGGVGHAGAMAGSNLFGIASSQYSQPGQGYGCGGSNGHSGYVSGAGNNGIVVVWEFK
jgi:hypothetical protein